MTPSEVKSYREENNLTQKQLAHLLGCSKRTVESWEGGKIEKFSNMGQKMWDQFLEKENTSLTKEEVEELLNE